MVAKLINLDTNETVVVDQSPFRIGKEQSYVDWYIANPMLSRVHCELTRQGDQWYVMDTNSTNHSYINGKMMPSNQLHSLSAEDIVQLGNVRLRFILDEEAEQQIKHDVFISFRSSDENNNPTKDVQLAESLYYALLKKGYHPFFSKKTLEIQGQADYVNAINDALSTAKVLVAVGSSRKNLESRWVNDEITIFKALKMREEDGARTLLSYRTPDYSVNDLPVSLVACQSFADESALMRFVETILRSASGFRHRDARGTEVLYAGFNETCILTQGYNETTVLSASPAISAVSPMMKNQNLQIGDLVDGRYEILNKIGQGGMSCVFLARDKRTDRYYAIKETRKKNKQDEQIAMQALRDELNMIRRLDHVGIPAIIDVIDKEESLLVIMEYVAGVSMKQMLDKYGAQDELFVRDVFRQLATILQYLHNRTTPIIYRDMKPANIMLRPEGTIKLIDFGTARYYRENALGDTVCLGTMGYAAPEQFGGMGQTDARTDIYALGVTIYHLVTGRDPSQPPYEIQPIRQINSHLSRGLEKIIQTCTQKDPNKRYQSIDDLLADLDNIDRLGGKFSLPRKKQSAPRREKPAPAPKKPEQSFHIPGQVTPPSVQPVRPSAPMPVQPIRASAPIPIRQSGGQPVSPSFSTPVRPPIPPTSAADVPAELAKAWEALSPQSKKILMELIHHLENK